MNSIVNTTLLLLFACAQSNTILAQPLDENYFDSNGTTIYYQDSKHGDQTIVLLHGFAMDHTMWSAADTYGSLAENHRVIAMDLRGHGKSDKPTNVSDYGPQVGLDVISLLDQLEITDAHMVGFSMGAYVIGRLLITHPDRISSATLCSGGFPLQNEQEKEYQVTTARHMSEDGDHALASLALGWAQDGVSKDDIPKIKTPMLAVFGSEEMTETVRQQIDLLELPTSAQPTLIIEGADHDSPKAAVLHPLFLSAVEKFIRSIK